MTDQQPQLLTLPTRYYYSQQPHQILEELPIQLHLLSRCAITGCDPSRMPPQFRLTFGGSFLFCYSISYPIYECDEECYVDGT